ncbi:MAG: endo-1,4-beta-xylanase, partial [Lachnospiraceae bacterium]|nr:endo-1,4-beta-xylanase [Lachnospiraceae bacterium]
LVIPAISAPESQAAAKPKLAKKVSVTVGSTKKITVKKVKAKKIKNTTWKIAKKKIAKITKKKNNFVKVKGLKKGNTTLTAKVKVGKKTYKLKTTVNVTKATMTPKPNPTATATATATNSGGGNGGGNNGGSNGDTNTPTPTPATPSPTPTLRPLTSVSPVEVPKQDADVFPTTPPNPTVDPAKKDTFSADFENQTVGDNITGIDVPEDADEDSDEYESYFDYGDIEGVTLRRGATAGDSITVASGGHDSDKCIVIHRKEKSWQGALVDLTNGTEPGCKYTFTAWVKCADATATVMMSYQLKATEDTKEEYDNLVIKSNLSEWTKIEQEISIPDDKYSYGVYFETSGGTADIYLDDITLTQTTVTNPDKTITSLKDTYGTIFDIVGVGAGTASLFGPNGSEFIVDQYNAYTPGNEMKPDAIMGSSLTTITVEAAKEQGYIIPDDYTKYDDNRKNTTDNSGDFIVPKLDFTTVDQIMKECHEKGLKLRGHTLVWHEQTPSSFFQQNYRTSNSATYNTTQEVMDVRLEFYIRNVLEHVLSSEYADCLYGYDVVNEYLHSANAASEKKTYWGSIYGTPTSGVKSGVTLRPSYVKKAFELADEMLKKHNRKDVKLFYNDYNCYQYPDDVVHLTDFINEDGKICDGIGMQSHLDISQTFHSANNYATALEFFRVNAADLEIHITELDATMVSNEDNPLTDRDQAAYYDQIMNAILTNKKNGGNITGLVIWSLYDGVSWRAQKYPCIFSGLYAPKSAFYAVIDAKARYWTTE